MKAEIYGTVVADFGVCMPLNLRLEYSCCVNLPFNVSDLLPVTALVAIAVFIAREVLEWRRRSKAEARKIQAVKMILARECELNFSTIRRLQYIFSHASVIDEENSRRKLLIEERPDGHLARMFDEDDLEATVPVPEVHRETVAKMLIETAGLERNLFLNVEAAHDALSETEHVRSSLIHIHETEKETGNEMVSGLADYATGELKNAEEALKKLYRFCTGEELTKARLR